MLTDNNSSDERSDSMEMLRDKIYFFEDFFNSSEEGFFILIFKVPIRTENGIIGEKDFEYTYYQSKIDFLNTALINMNEWQTGKQEMLTSADLFINDVEVGISLWNELFQNGRCQIVKVIPRGDEKKVYISGVYQTINDGDGFVCGIYGIERDITGLKENEIELIRKKDEMERFFTVALDLLCIADIEGRLLKINRAWERTLGYTLEDLADNAFKDFIHPEDVSSTLRAFAALADQMPVMSFTNRFRTSNGDYRFIEWRGYPSGRYIYLAARDITERINYEIELNKLAERLTLAAGSAGIGIWDWDIVSDELIWDHRMYELYGIKKETAPDVYNIWIDIVHPDDRGRVEAEFREGVKSLAMFNSDFRVIWYDGSVHYLEGHALVVRNVKGRAERITGVTWDITANKQMEERLVAMSVTDPLTLAYNRRYLLKVLDTEINRANRYNAPFSLIMFDLDHFKNVNDTYGHDVGDEILKMTASVMKNRIRKNDILSRWGGEEFMILLPGTGIENAGVLADKLLTELRNTDFGQQPGGITASFGVTEYRSDETADNLLKRTDELVYLAKNEGRNCIRCIP